MVLGSSCDDGEIIVQNLAFTNVNVEVCNVVQTSPTSRSYVFYKLDRTNNESISLELTIPDNLLEVNGTYGPYPLNNTNRIEYRKFNSQPPTNYFCNSVPSTSPTVSQIFISTGGTVTIETITETEDDNDGIPAEIEGFTADTDGDGIPDYLDDDDDGDNVPTIEEGVIIIDGVISPLSRDTDGDGIYDYLDNDDDNDGVLTIQEDLNRDLNPANDLQLNGLPAYLDPATRIPASPAITTYRVNTTVGNKRVVITISNLTLTSDGAEIIQQQYNFGTYITPQRQILRQPTF